jgi:WD40 repeat protein
MPRTACPTPDELRAFQQGDLPDVLLDDLTTHLEACAACEAAAQTLDGVFDPVIAAFRQSARAAPLPAAAIPARVGGYDILGEIGRGGMGVVYQARHRRLPRTVALKMLLRGAYADPEERARFRAEADAVARLQHPNIVHIYEVGEHDAGDGVSRPYFTLEFVEGESLSARMGGRPQPPRQASAWVEAIARAVHFAHTQGIVHRDLKPSNVLLAADGQPKLCDFGVAKLLTGSDVKTQSGAVLGTIEYMAPEQAAGEATVGPPADVYALGAILYTALTGRPPFQGTTALLTLEQVQHQDPVPPRQLVPAVPRDLNTICLKCLEKKPVGRYVSAEALAEDLHHFLAGEPIVARPVTAWERAWKWTRRRPALAGLLALSLLVLVVGFPGAMVLWLRADRARVAADEARDDLESAVYAGRIALADHAYQADDVTAARQLLAHCSPEPGRPDQRGWEWHYLDRLCHADLFPDLGHTADHNGWVFGLAFTADGRSLVSSAGLPAGALAGFSTSPAPTTPGESKVWETASGRCLATLSGHTGAVWALAKSPDGRRFATGGADGTVRLWDALTFADLGTIPAADGNVLSLAFSPDSRLLAIASVSGIVVWDLDARQAKYRFPDKCAGASLAFAVSPDARLVFGPVEHNGRVGSRIVDLSTGQDVAHQLPAAAICAAFRADGKFLALAVPGDHRVQIWDAAGTKLLRQLTGHTNEVLALAFAPDGRLISAGDDRTVRLWDPATGVALAEYRGHTLGVLSLAVSPDGSGLASGDKVGSVKIWDLTRDPRGVTIERTQWGGEYFDHLAFSADGQSVIVVADMDETSRVHNIAHWDPTNGRLLRRHAIGPKLPDELWHRTYAISSDGRRLAGADWADKQAINVFDTADGHRMTTLSTAAASVRTVALDRAGERVAIAGWTATSGDDGPHAELVVSDVNTGRVLRQPSLPASYVVTQVALSPDGRRLAGAVRELIRQGGTIVPGPTSSISVWEVDAASEPIVVAARVEGPVTSVAFGPDGSRLAFAGADGMVRLHNAVTGREVCSPMASSSAATGLAFSPDGRRLAGVGMDGLVRLWDTAAGHELLTLRGLGIRGSGHYGFTARVTFSPDGSRLAANDWDGTVTIWEAGAASGR